jgi:hypothetical protein
MSESTPPPAQGQTDATPTPTGEVRNYAENWARAKNVALSWVYAARAQAKWSPDALITETEFNDAIGSVQDIQINAVHNERGPGEGK